MGSWPQGATAAEQLELQTTQALDPANHTPRGMSAYEVPDGRVEGVVKGV